MSYTGKSGYLNGSEKKIVVTKMWFDECLQKVLDFSSNV
jgi:hypothetical protein